METRFDVNQILFTFTELIFCKSIIKANVNENCKSGKLMGNFIEKHKNLLVFTFTLIYIYIILYYFF